MDIDEAGNPVATSMYYRIRFGCLLSASWVDWFDGLTLTHEVGATVIEGALVDHAALYGLLDRARDLGLPLLEVRRIS